MSWNCSARSIPTASTRPSLPNPLHGNDCCQAARRTGKTQRRADGTVLAGRHPLGRQTCPRSRQGRGLRRAIKGQAHPSAPCRDPPCPAKVEPSAPLSTSGLTSPVRRSRLRPAAVGARRCQGWPEATRRAWPSRRWDRLDTGVPGTTPLRQSSPRVDVSVSTGPTVTGSGATGSGPGSDRSRSPTDVGGLVVVHGVGGLRGDSVFGLSAPGRCGRGSVGRAIGQGQAC
jgi:hypothetical protein